MLKNKVLIIAYKAVYSYCALKVHTELNQKPSYSFLPFDIQGFVLEGIDNMPSFTFV